jgi:hypothetical protein
VFPVHDSQGQLVAYVGRSLDGSQPRYRFPPGFHKSQVVFNLHRAVREAAGCAMVVEGLFHCLRVHQAGYHHVMALMGVTLSEAQEQLLRERFPRLILMLRAGSSSNRETRPKSPRAQAGKFHDLGFEFRSFVLVPGTLLGGRRWTRR